MTHGLFFTHPPHIRFLSIMAMSRFFSQYLHRSSIGPPIPIATHLRRRSSKTHHAQLIEVDLDASSSSQPDSAEAGSEIITEVGKLEEAIHSIIVRRTAPDWLPFLPGYSYWVPPRSTLMRNHPAVNIIGVFEDLNSSRATMGRRLQDELSDDEKMSFSSTKGWPSSAIFIEGKSKFYAFSPNFSIFKLGNWR